MARLKPILITVIACSAIVFVGQISFHTGKPARLVKQGHVVLQTLASMRDSLRGHVTNITWSSAWEKASLSAINSRLSTYTYNSSTNSTAAVITLFTSMRDVPEKEQIHTNTLINWSALRPGVNPILYVPSMNMKWVAAARQAGWTVRLIPKSKVDTPVLRHMFLDAMTVSRTPFYAFSNADILYDGGLISTLEFFVRAGYDKSRGFLAVGLRTNVPLSLIKGDVKPSAIQTLASKGKRFVTNAQDYFITSAEGYPWTDIPDFVVGRRAYDNWLVVQALRWNFTLVDCSGTVPAVHQTGHDGNFAGHRHKDGEINARLAGPFNYGPGHNVCAALYTEASSKGGEVLIKTRSETPSHCKIRMTKRIPTHVNTHS